MDCEILKSTSAIIAASMTGAVAILLFLYKRKDDELTLVKNKVSDEKYKAYFEIASLFFDILKSQQGLKKFGQNDLAIRYIELKKYILLLGSDEVFRKFNEFDKNIAAYENDKDISKIKFWLELFILIRKDCGNPKTKVSTDDILRSIMKSEEEYIKMKDLINK